MYDRTIQGQTINELGGGPGRKFVLSFYFLANRLMSFPRKQQLSFFPRGEGGKFFPRFCLTPLQRSVMVRSLRMKCTHCGILCTNAPGFLLYNAVFGFLHLDYMAFIFTCCKVYIHLLTDVLQGEVMSLHSYSTPPFHSAGSHINGMDII